MKITTHADRTETELGLRAEDIHTWIDEFFDTESFDFFLRTGSRAGFNPYNHRKYRHCAEALEDAYSEFEGKYTREQIRAVFERHIKDDYDGFMPLQEDFESGAFTERYHESNRSEEMENILSEAELSEYFKGKSYPRSGVDPRRLSARFYWHIVWPTAIAALLFALSAFTVIVPIFRNGLMKQKREMIKELTSTAASAIGYYIQQEQSGAMTRDEAQSQASAEIAELRYGVERKDYFWITDMHPYMVMHPYRPELVGRDLTGYTDRKDKSGKKLFIEFVDLVQKNGEGYLEYMWQWMDDPSRAEPKLSYVRGVPEWGWVIGTGIYIHDVEQEIARLTRHLLVADGVVAVVLLGLLANVVFQSRRIEIDRKRAETGLREAKDRYRALVEGSKEGYVLEMDGETVYSNHTLRRMTGYSETEMAGMKVWELLEPGSDINVPAMEHLKKIYEHTASAMECEARILTKQGDPLDVQISTSRIFFTEKNGHVISFTEISRGRQHTLKAFSGGSESVSLLRRGEIPQQIAESVTAGQVIQVLKQLPDLIRSMTDQGTRPEILRETIGSAYDAAIRRFIDQALEEQGLLPVPFAFLSLGSNARHEMTLFSDQDNALVFADVPADRLNEVRRRFLKLADEVCSKLNKAGYPYCPGGIMAANPKWCLSLSEWKSCFDRWILDAAPQSILDVHVFFDLRCAYGDEELPQKMREHVQVLTGRNPEFFIHFAHNCLGYKPPRLRRGKTSGSVDLKACILPIETFARIYALKQGMSVAGTLERLKRLHDAEVLKEDTCREMVYVFDYLWQLRFFNQITANVELSADTDELNLETLSDIERENLQSLLERIPTYQAKLSYDFLGMQV